MGKGASGCEWGERQMLLVKRPKLPPYTVVKRPATFLPLPRKDLREETPERNENEKGRKGKRSDIRTRAPHGAKADHEKRGKSGNDKFTKKNEKRTQCRNTHAPKEKKNPALFFVPPPVRGHRDIRKRKLGEIKEHAKRGRTSRSNQTGACSGSLL